MARRWRACPRRPYVPARRPNTKASFLRASAARVLRSADSGAWNVTSVRVSGIDRGDAQDAADLGDLQENLVGPG
ncbi:MAG: hypothetical protein HC871_05200 [Rhizobiales bacterium]|nr:hypothetical protein [Hyphomicrobiales bacterium]